jgi:hypothetical protein
MATMIKARDLRLGDTVILFDGAYGSAAVTQIAGGLVSFFRPYATTSDFACTGGVIPYVGIEQFSRMSDSDELYRVEYRREVR